MHCWQEFSKQIYLPERGDFLFIMKSFLLKDVSTKETYGSIACGVIPIIGSKLKIVSDDKEHVFRVRDLEYIVYQGSDAYDVEIIVSRE